MFRRKQIQYLIVFATLILLAYSGAARSGAPPAVPVLTLSPVVLAAPERGEDLTVRVSTPLTGRDLPIILFAHGNALSSDDYTPLVNFWAGHGFVVIQPTFLDSKTMDLRPEDPRTARIWRYRVADMKRILDNLDIIEDAVPGLTGRLDRSRIAVVGHSYGGITAAMLLGSKVLGPDGGQENLSDPRIKAGVLLSTAGRGGSDLSEFAATRFPFMNRTFVDVIKPVLVVAGDQDVSPLTVRGPDWFTDSYTLSSGDKCLVTLFGAGHMLGGISGTPVDQMSQINPDHVNAVQRLSWAYLRSALYSGDTAWRAEYAAMMKAGKPLGKVECK